MSSENRALAGRVALVSGGSGDIGSAVVDELRARGARVVALDTRPPATGDVPFVEADVTDDDSVQSAVDKVAAMHGGLDLVVHCAGINLDRVLWKLGVGEWDEVQAVNLRGAFLLLRHAVPMLRRRGGGRIVLIGSVSGSRGNFGQTAYAASKAGLVGLAKSAARETARFGILVNVVEPGMVRTRMTAAMSGEALSEAVSGSLLGMLVEPADVAHGVAFLCGPGARMITGQTLRVDGGRYL
jgi:NAD(P)-dependent dehydrogenase (short-subunit alcohol dehydrogenase family)